MKGFPENDNTENNIYDYDPRLDNYGKLHNSLERMFFVVLFWTGKDEPENVIFFKYTGEEIYNKQATEFYRKVEPIVGDDAYDDAYLLRDKSIKKDLELKKWQKNIQWLMKSLKKGL